MNLVNPAVNFLEHDNEIECSDCSEKICIQGKTPFSIDSCSHCESEFQVPMFLEQFRLESVLKDDAVFTEYQAFDTLLNRNVFLKKLKKEYHQKDSEPSFPFIDCPGAVNIFSTFTHEDDLYFIFEALKGYSIKSYLRRKSTIDVKKAISLAMSICKIMSGVAEEGINHGHLVTDSIWINEEGEVLIRDFMLRQNLVSKNDSAERISEIFDVRFCSKERFETLAVSEKSDLYSLGVFLYRILTGTYPFVSNENNELLLEQIDLSALDETGLVAKELILRLISEEGCFNSFSEVLEYLQTTFVSKKSKNPSSKSSKKSRVLPGKSSSTKSKKKTQVKLPAKGKSTGKKSKTTLKKLFR